MLERRDGSPYWHIRFTLKGVQVRQSSGTSDKKRAEALEEQLRREIWDNKHGMGPSKTWVEGVIEWTTRKTSKRSLKRDEEILSMAGEVFGNARLDEIDTRAIAEYGAQIAKNTSTSNANRHLAQLRAFFNAMARWKMMFCAPPSIELYPPTEKELVTLTPAQFERLKAELPPHVLRFASFAAETGIRRGNISWLRWDAPPPGRSWPYIADDCVVIPPRNAKGKKPLVLPLSIEAQRIVNTPRSDAGYVFTDISGTRRVGDIRKAWDGACKRVGLEGLRIHDLRHAWATWHIASGTPSRIVQELGGWSSEKMLKRYTHFDVAHLKAFVK